MADAGCESLLLFYVSEANYVFYVFQVMKYLYTAEIIVFIIGAENRLDFLTSGKKMNYCLYLCPAFLR